MAHAQKDSLLKFQYALTAIASAKPSDSFADIIADNRAHFAGLHIAYATKASELKVQDVNLDEITSECSLVSSFFCGSGLLFYTDEIYRQTLAGEAQICLDFSISLDKNVAEAVRLFAEGKQYSQPDNFGRLLHLLKGRGERSFNFDYLGYLVEESEHMALPGNRRPLATLTALKLLDHLSPQAWIEEGVKPEFTISRQQAELAAQTALTWVSTSGDMQQLQDRHVGIYALLLKAVALRWSNVEPLEALAEVVKFSFDVLGKLAKFEIYFASKLLGCAGTVPPFFHPISSPTSKGVQSIRGISWDIAMFRMAELAAGSPRAQGTRQADFFVPLVASFDAKFKQLVQACPLKAIVLDPVTGQGNSIFWDELDFQHQLRHAAQRVKGIDQSGPAALKRQAAKLDVGRMRRAISELEQTVNRLVA